MAKLVPDHSAVPAFTHIPVIPHKVQYAPNPFIPLAGRISDPEQVFDRGDEIKRVFDFLQAGSSIALIGPEGIGKSSLITKLCDSTTPYLRRFWKVLYFDLQIIFSENEFYEVLCKKLGIATCQGYALVQCLQGRQVLLCLDEIEKITWKGFSASLRAQLRGLAEGREAPLKLVLAARTPLDHLFPDSAGMTSPLANICSQMDIASWDEQTIRAFLIERLAGTNLTFSSEDITRLVQQSSGHPGRLMQAAFALYEERSGGYS